MPNAGKASKAIVETLDIFPTLVELAKLPSAAFAHGASLGSIIASPTDASGRPAIGYHGRARTIRTDTHRLIAHKNGHLELYDHRTADSETKNLATSQPDIAEELLKKLEARLSKPGK